MSDVYSIYEAKARLSEIIRAVKRKRRVTITQRGVPVAEVVPHGGDRRPTIEERIVELEARGVLSARPAGRPVDAIAPIAGRPGALARFLADR